MPKNYAKGIRQRGNIFYLSFTPAKGQKQKHVCLNTSDYLEAVEKAKSIRERPSIAKIGIWEHDMADYIVFRLQRRTMSDDTVRTTQEAILRFFEFVSKKTVQEITDDDVLKFINGLGKLGRTQSTVNTYHARLSGFYKYLVHFGKVESNPFDAIGVHKIEPHQIAREKWIDKNQIRKLLNKCKNPNLKFVLYCGFHAGMRKREIIMARPSFFDLKQHKINIPHLDDTDHNGRQYRFRPKNKKPRSIPLSTEFHKFLSKEFPMEGKTFCLEVKGKGWGDRYRYDFRRPLEEFFRKNGIDLTTHGMRHSFASNCIMANISTFKVARWMGNQERTLEAHYAHLATGRQDLAEVF